MAKQKNKALNKQMELFEDGGLKDEGGMIDEESGNDVPIGSTREEVRDDIPAQLSEGEFVFPADVVRFIGLEKLMTIRQKAKEGLQKMEDMGQMGNSEEATIPDDVPFDVDDLDMEDDKEEEVPDSNFNRGGVVKMAEGGTTPTTENTDLNNTTTNNSNLNPRQQSVPIRTSANITSTPTTAALPNAPIQSPLNPRQQQVPTRNVTNIPSTKDFLNKNNVTELKSTYSVPDELGSRFLKGMEIKSISETNKSKQVVEKDLTDILNYNYLNDLPSEDGGEGGNDNDGGTSGSGSSGGIADVESYADVDVMSLNDDLRSVHMDFAKAQLSMFSVVTSNPFSVALSAIGMNLGQATKGLTVGGPVKSAEYGKAIATSFNNTVTAVQSKYGEKSKNYSSWGAKAQAELAERGRLGIDLTTDIMNSKYGVQSRSFTDVDKSTKDKAMGFVNSVIGTVNSAVNPTTQAQHAKGMLDAVNNAVAASKAQKSALDMQANIAQMAKASLAAKAKAKAEMEADVDAGTQAEDISITDEMTALGFSSGAQASVEANGGSKGFGTNPNGTSYSINVNGSFTHTNNVTTNVTDSKGNPINQPKGKDAADANAAADAAADAAQSAANDAANAAANDGDNSTGNTDNTGSQAGVDGPGSVGSSQGNSQSNASNTSNNSTSTNSTTDHSNNTNTTDNDSGGADDGGGGGGSHICTATYNIGHINKEHFTTLKKYGIILRRTDPYMMKAYDVFGPKVASLVNSNKYVTSFAKFITQYYKDTMDNKPLSIKQKLFNILSVTILRPMWRLIGRFV